METDPYRTPAARLIVERKSPSMVRSIAGPLAGVTVDILGTSLFGIIFTTALAIWLATTGAAPELIVQRLEDLGATPAFYLPGALIGLAFTALGGYIAARIARRAELLHSGATGVLSMLFGFVLFEDAYVPSMRWFLWLGLALTIPAALLGGWLAHRKNV